MATVYDAIVVGTGGAGSSALFHLAARGLRVLGLDRFPGGHDRGSSHGHTRIIRQAYAEHPDYVPLVQRAYQLWHELENAAGETLYHETGLLQAGPREGEIIRGVLASAQQHHLPVQPLSAADVNLIYPQFHIPDSLTAVFERRAGVLMVERCVLSHLDLARRHGAELVTGQAVQRWQASSSGVTVTTDRETFHAARLVLTAGPWARDLLRELAVPLTILRKHLHWFATPDRRYEQHAGCPAFLFELPEGIFYGMPKMDPRGVKFAEHSGGQSVTDPLHVNRTPDLHDLTRVQQALRQCLPGVSEKATDHVVCMYTMSPDHHFLVDCHPRFAHVALAAGLSGHGFKFTSVLGEVLTELVLEGKSSLPIGRFRLERFGSS